MKFERRLLIAFITIVGLSFSSGWFLSWDGKSTKTEEEAIITNSGDRYEVMEKSIGFYVGSDLTDDGSTFLGGFGHEPSSHWIDIVPAQDHPTGATVTVGVTGEANIKGELIDIPQASRTNKYISSTYSEYAGFPAPLTNGGLNEHGLATRDIWSPSRDDLVAMTEEPQQGPNYSDLARIAMERATSAREAVEIIGGLIDEYGYSTYGGNSHLFADVNEGWVFINYAGGQGLWAAERLGPNEVRVSYPGYINDFPVDYMNDDDYMGSDNLVDFAREQGWWNPGEDDTNYLDLQEVYGKPFPGEGVDGEDDYYLAARMPHDLEAELGTLAPITLEYMLAYVRDPRWSNDLSGYGQVAHLRPDIHSELQTLWLATTGAVTTPFVPIPIVTELVPPEFLQHRYMTKDSDSEFLSADYALQEATRYAVREFKRLMYFTCENPKDFLQHVTGIIESFEIEMLNEREVLESEAVLLIEAGREPEARDLISQNVRQRLLESLTLSMGLTNEIERETRELYGIRRAEGVYKEGETTPAFSQSMSMRNVSDLITCYDVDLDEYPRAHGIYSEGN